MSEPAFVEILEELKPEFILALGFRLWDRLPDLNGYQGPIIEGAKRHRTWFYPHSTGRALAYCIKHPSSGFSPLKEHPYVVLAMEKARELIQNNREGKDWPLEHHATSSASTNRNPFQAS